MHWKCAVLLFFLFVLLDVFKLFMFQFSSTLIWMDMQTSLQSIEVGMDIYVRDEILRDVLAMS